MTKPIIRIHNAQTDETIDREMTDEEFAVYQTEQEVIAKAQAEAEAKALAKTALLERLGITQEEAAVLFG